VSTTTRGGFGQPALLGGAVMGVLSALPLISAFNLCCCLWVITGGVVAAYILQQNQSAPITPGDGALAGLFAGIVGAVIYLLLSIPISILMAPFERELLERIINNAGGGIPPEYRDYVGTGLGRTIQLVVGFFFMLIVGGIFSTLGGLLGAAIFKKPLHGPAQDLPH
jgi:hypothetical protein